MDRKAVVICKSNLALSSQNSPCLNLTVGYAYSCMAVLQLWHQLGNILDTTIPSMFHVFSLNPGFGIPVQIHCQQWLTLRLDDTTEFLPLLPSSDGIL